MVENKIAVDRNHAGTEAHPGQPCRHGGVDCHGRHLLARLRRCGQRARTLPRHLYVAILRLLRPAEAATRRLVIVLARGIVRHAAAAAGGQAKARTGVAEGWQGDRHRRHWHLPLQAWSRQCRTAAHCAKAHRCSYPPARLPAAGPLAQSLPPPPPPQLEAEHRCAPLPARPHRAACHSGAAPVAP